MSCQKWSWITKILRSRDYYNEICCYYVNVLHSLLLLGIWFVCKTVDRVSRDVASLYRKARWAAKNEVWSPKLCIRCPSLRLVDPQNNTKQVNWPPKTVRSIEIFYLKRLFETRSVMDTTSNAYLGVFFDFEMMCFSISGHEITDFDAKTVLQGEISSIWDSWPPETSEIKYLYHFLKSFSKTLFFGKVNFSTKKTMIFQKNVFSSSMVATASWPSTCDWCSLDHQY